MLKRLKALFATTEGKLKVLILVSGSAILLVTLSAGALVISNTPVFCSLCHEMSPEYYTWMASSHSKIPCVDCHVKPGLKNELEHKVESLQQLYFHVTGTFPKPISLTEPIPNSTCEQCHNMDNRITNAPGDIKFPHLTHLANGVNCVDCHSGIAHGNIEEKGFTALTNYDKWNAVVGKAYIDAGFSKISMNVCISCHEDGNAPVTCETCHTKIVKPANHTSLNWLSEHGKLAEQNVAACDKCHANTSNLGDYAPTELTAATYARANTFCNTCHAKEPLSHYDAYWKKDHENFAKTDKAGCLVCHDEDGDSSSDNAPSTIICMKCHNNTHTEQLEQSHPVTIPPTGLEAMCFQCHSSSGCLVCHAVPRH